VFRYKLANSVTNMLKVSYIFYCVLGGSTVVEHSTHNPKIEGSNPSAGSGREIVSTYFTVGCRNRMFWPIPKSGSLCPTEVNPGTNVIKNFGLNL
jgi:hypothetical protein